MKWNYRRSTNSATVIPCEGGEPNARRPGFAALLLERLAPLGRITPRRMFGKTGLFCDGVMFGMAADGALFVRVDDENRAVFQEAAAHPPLNYTKAGNTIDLTFWRVPDRLFDEREELVV